MPRAMHCDSFIGECLEIASLCAALDRGIKSPRVEFLEPGTKPRQFVRWEPFDGLRDVVRGRHAGNIAVCIQDEKRCRGALLLFAAARMCYFRG